MLWICIWKEVNDQTKMMIHRMGCVINISETMVECTDPNGYDSLNPVSDWFAYKIINLRQLLLHTIMH